MQNICRNVWPEFGCFFCECVPCLELILDVMHQMKWNQEEQRAEHNSKVNTIVKRKIISGFEREWSYSCASVLFRAPYGTSDAPKNLNEKRSIQWQSASSKPGQWWRRTFKAKRNFQQIGQILITVTSIGNHLMCFVRLLHSFVWLAQNGPSNSRNRPM